MANHAGYTIYNYPTSPSIKWWQADKYSMTLFNGA